MNEIDRKIIKIWKFHILKKIEFFCIIYYLIEKIFVALNNFGTKDVLKYFWIRIDAHEIEKYLEIIQKCNLRFLKKIKKLIFGLFDIHASS